jgi:hypothetical protein
MSAVRPIKLRRQQSMLLNTRNSAHIDLTGGILPGVRPEPVAARSEEE